MKHKKIKAICFIGLAVLLTGCRGKNPTDGVKYQWVASNDMAAEAPWDLSLKEFGRLLNEKSNGQIELTVYSGGSLQSEIDSIAGVQMGTVDFVIANTSNLSSFTNSQRIWDLPYLFSDLDDARTVCRSDAAQNVLDGLSGDGIKGLCYWESGMTEIALTKEAHSLADLKGLKIRSMNNSIHAKLYECYGANPVVLSWGDIYTGLQQGTIDGISSTAVVNMCSSHFEEVAPYILETDQQYAQGALCMSQKVWDSLPEDIKNIVMESAKEAQQYEYDLMDENRKTVYEKMKESGVEFIQVDKEEFAKAVEPLYEQYVGKDGIDADQVAMIKAAGK